MEKNLYDVLGVSENASKEQLQKAFKRKAMKYHPDRNKSEDAEDRFKEIHNAYSVLADDEKRARYDQFGEAGLDGIGPGFDGSPFGDIFDQLFRGGGSPFGFGGEQGRPTRRRGADISVSCAIELEEAVRGRRINLRINAQDTCDDCNGSGMAKGSRREECPDCDGSGMVRRSVAMFSMQETCRRCRGTGEIIKDPCKSCGGTGATKRKRDIEVNIPAGIDDGDTLRVRSKGAMGSQPGSERGDLLLSVSVRPHEIFDRERDNLRCEMPVPLTTAILGGKVKVPTLLDGYIEHELPKGTQNGAILRLRGKGVRGVRSGSQGDLFCSIAIEVPQRLSKEQERLVRQLDESLNDDPDRHAPKVSGWTDKVRRLFSKKGGHRDQPGAP